MASQQNASSEAELEALFISFARVTLNHMEEWAASEGIPQSFHRYVDFTKEGTRSRFEMKRDYTKILLLHLDDPLWTTKVVEDCIRLHRVAWNLFPLKEEEEGLLFNPLPPTIDGTVLQFFWLFIVNALESYRTFQLTEEQLVKNYERIREMRKVKNWRWSVIIPLLGFTSDIGRMEHISTYLQLAPFTAEEKADLWNRETVELEMQPLFRVPGVRDIDVQAFSSTKYKLAGMFVTEEQGLYDYQQVFDDAENVLTALRLVKAGDVGVLAFFSGLDEPSALKGPHFMKLPDERLRKKKSIYRLSEADLATVKVLSSSLHQLDKQKSNLALALRRFNIVYSRDVSEDQIIDLTIALESSLLAGLRDELNYRLSLRGAALLADADPSWEPSMSQLLLKVMYDVRSSIVHSGKRLIDLQKDTKKLQHFGISPSTFPYWCEKIVREILKIYVLQQAKKQSVEQVNQELDRRILEGLAPHTDVEEK